MRRASRSGRALEVLAGCSLVLSGAPFCPDVVLNSTRSCLSSSWVVVVIQTTASSSSRNVASPWPRNVAARGWMVHQHVVKVQPARGHVQGKLSPDFGFARSARCLCGWRDELVGRRAGRLLLRRRVSILQRVDGEREHQGGWGVGGLAALLCTAPFPWASGYKLLAPAEGSLSRLRQGGGPSNRHHTPGPAKREPWACRRGTLQSL
jgi:hypothetical protein